MNKASAQELELWSKRYGSLGDSAGWKIVMEHYYADRLAEANAAALELGVGVVANYEGMYRMIDAEWSTRRYSHISDASPWLRVESIPKETVGAVDLDEVILRACNEVADRFGYGERAKTMASVLAVEADAPWAVGRFGYMIEKVPYAKICLPNNRIRNEAALHEVVAHEFAHVVVLNLSEGRAPKWLNEGVAMLAERSSDVRVRRAFSSGQVPWLTARELEIAHSGNRQGEPHPMQTWLAYQQSAWVARYLVSVGGEKKVGQLLRSMVEHSTWIEIRVRLTGQSWADEALKHTYGFGEEKLFAETLKWLK